MSYHDLRDALAAADIRVRAVNGKLRVTRASRLTPALRDALRLYKDRLLAECALPLWAQVYVAFGGGDVYEGRRKLRPQRIACEMARLTQRGLELPAFPPSSESRGGQENPVPAPPPYEGPCLHWQTWKAQSLGSGEHPCSQSLGSGEQGGREGVMREGALHRHVRPLL